MKLNICFDCKECIHSVVCKEKEIDIPETIGQLGETISNIGYQTSTLESQIACKEFIPKSKIKIILS